MSDVFKSITVDAPWTNGEQEFKGMLGFFQQTKMQLLHYQQQPNGDTEAIRADIAGYDEILKSGKEENARAFMELKSEARRSTNPLYGKGNLGIVNALKEQGKWI